MNSKGQALIYEFNTGKIEEINKEKYIDLMISLKITSMKKEDLMKLSYAEIIKLHKNNLQEIEKNIFIFKEKVNRIVIACLIDKYFEDFKEYCKKHNWKIEGEVDYKNTILKEFKDHVTNGVYAYCQINMAYNSSRMEGNTITKDDTYVMFETKQLTIKEYDKKYKEELFGHFQMFNEMLKSINKPLSIDIINNLQKTLMQYSSWYKEYGFELGKFRRRMVTVGDLQIPNPNDIDLLMNKILIKYANSNKTVKDIFEFHKSFERIHPYCEGNGRVGRMIMFRESLNTGITPIIILDENKNIYYKALMEDEDGTQMIKYFQNKLIANGG